MADHDDYLLQPVVGQGGVWVRLVNNTTSTAYVSTAATGVDGHYRMSNIPAGAYTVSTGPSSGGSWTATGDVNYIVTDQTPVKGVAAPTGVAATDTANINNALATLPVTGGVVQLQAGTYVVNATLNIGNGTSSVYSIINGVILRGASPAAALWATGAKGATTIQWAGSQPNAVISVQGPIWGWGLQDLVVDGGAAIVAAQGIKVKSAQVGNNRNLAIVNCACGIDESSYVQFGAPNINTMHNRWSGVAVWVPDYAGAIGVRMDGNGVDAYTNTCFERYDDLSLLFASTTGTQYGIYLKTVDSVTFRGVHMNGGPTPTHVKAITYDYTGTSGAYPATTLIDTIDFGSASVAIQNIGLPDGGGLNPNTIAYISTVNGRLADPGLANLNWDGTFLDLRVRALTGGAGISSYIVASIDGSGKGTFGNISQAQLLPALAGMECWKDATPTAGAAIGLAVPGNALTNDMIFSTYPTTGAWIERMRIASATGLVTFGAIAGPTASIDSTGKGTFTGGLVSGGTITSPDYANLVLQSGGIGPTTIHVRGVGSGGVYENYNGGTDGTTFFNGTTTQVGKISSAGDLTLTKGGAFWGHAAVASQPAAPTLLADVIAIIRGCGLSA